MSETKRSWISVVAIGLVSSLFAFSAGAHPGDRIAEQLELTETQQQSLESIRAEQRLTRESARAGREEVAALAKSGNIDGAAALAADQARERVYRRAEMRRRISEVLTPEQIEQMEALRDNREERRGKRNRRHRQRAN